MDRVQCERCGNDGRQGALYVAVDARWRHELSAWELGPRDDSGGGYLDCLACDHNGADPFPYGALVPHDPDAKSMIRDALDILQPDGEEAEALRLRLLAMFSAA